MMENKIFQYALMISLAAHGFAATVFWLTDLTFPKRETPKVMEVVYKPVQEIKKEPVKILEVKRLMEEKKPDLPGPHSFQDEVKIPPVSVPEKAPAKLDGPGKSAGRLPEIGEKRHIRIPMLDSDKMMGPRYVTYHEQVREKIRNRAYFYVDDPRFETGEVYLTFVLSSDGGLREVQVIEGRTRANAYLRNIGLRSIRESSPFPPFPKDLSYPELTFNVVISFEMGD